MRFAKNIIIVLLMQTGFLFAQDLESLMREGNDYYQAKQYTEAINSYEAILKQGYLSSQLYYNLGNKIFHHKKPLQ